MTTFQKAKDLLNVLDYQDQAEVLMKLCDPLANEDEAVVAFWRSFAKHLNDLQTYVLWESNTDIISIYEENDELLEKRKTDLQQSSEIPAR